jgi:hypothetical protein
VINSDKGIFKAKNCVSEIHDVSASSEQFLWIHDAPTGSTGMALGHLLPEITMKSLIGFWHQHHK